MYLPFDDGDCPLIGMPSELVEWFRQQPGVDHGLAVAGALNVMVPAVGDRIYIDWNGDGEMETRSILHVAPAMPEEEPRFKALNDAFCRMVGAFDPDALADDVYFRAEGEEGVLWVVSNDTITSANGDETVPPADLVARLRTLQRFRKIRFNVGLLDTARNLLTLFRAQWSKEAQRWTDDLKDDREQLLLEVASYLAIDERPEEPIIDADMLMHVLPLVERHIRFRRELRTAMAKANNVVPIRPS